MNARPANSHSFNQEAANARRMQRTNDKFRSFDALIDEFLQDPEFFNAYMDEAFADGDRDAVSMCLKFLIDRQGGVTKFAAKAGLKTTEIGNFLHGKKGQSDVQLLLKLLHHSRLEMTNSNRKRTF